MTHEDLFIFCFEPVKPFRRGALPNGIPLSPVQARVGLTCSSGRCRPIGFSALVSRVSVLPPAQEAYPACGCALNVSRSEMDFTCSSEYNPHRSCLLRSRSFGREVIIFMKLSQKGLRPPILQETLPLSDMCPCVWNPRGWTTSFWPQWNCCSWTKLCVFLLAQVKGIIRNILRKWRLLWGFCWRHCSFAFGSGRGTVVWWLRVPTLEPSPHGLNPQSTTC